MVFFLTLHHNKKADIYYTCNVQILIQLHLVNIANKIRYYRTINFLFLM